MKQQYLQPTIDIERGITGMSVMQNVTVPITPDSGAQTDPTPAPWRY